MSLPELNSTIVPNNTVQTTVQEGATVNTLETAGNVVETTMVSPSPVYTTHNTVPIVQTIITKDTQDITSVVDGFWDVVWSVNGQTGDVLIDVVLGEFTSNTTYTKNSIISYNGAIYRARVNFTSTSTFNPSDWDIVNFTAVPSVNTFLANHQYIYGEMIQHDTKLYTAKYNFISTATFNLADWNQVGGGESSWGAIVGTLSDQTDLSTALGNKVDKENGKGLSTNDYTTTEKDKLSGIASGAEVNVQTDWNQSDNTADDFLKNKPTIGNGQLTIKKNGTQIAVFTANETDNINANITVPTKTSEITNDSNFPVDASYVHTDNNYTTSEKNQVSKISTIEGLIPTQATSSNQLADKAFVNSSLNSITAYYITKNAAGDPFSTKAELDSASTFYSGGVVRVPTRNDYCVVTADETKTDPVTSENPTTRYIYQNNGWEYQYTVNKTSLTAVQLAALNSGATSALMSKLDGIASGAEVNVNPDWNATSGDAQILNKPTVPNITVTSTDPGEGASLAANSFIAVYEA